MGFNRVVDADKDNKGVSGLPDTPNMTAAELQARFDSLAELALTKLNQLMDELENTSAAGNVGVIAPSTVKAGNTLQAVINALANSVNKNTTDSHTHANKEVLDAISAQNTKDWSGVVSLLKEITSIQNVLVDSTDGIPTSHAVYDAMFNISFEDVNEALKTALKQISDSKTDATTEVDTLVEEARTSAATASEKADEATVAATEATTAKNVVETAAEKTEKLEASASESADSASKSAESASESAKSASTSAQTAEELSMTVAANVTAAETNANKTEADKTIVEGYMESALSSKKAAATSEENAKASADAAAESYESVKNTIVSSGYAELDIKDDGHLWLYRSTAAETDIDFAIKDNKNLEVTFT